jgi:Flp pilus assembly protein CpaB
MRSANARRRRIPFGPLGVAAIVVVGVLTLLWTLGVVDAATFGFRRKMSTVGMTPVPISPSRIPAYTKITRDHLVDPREQNIAMLYLRKQQVTTGIITDVNKIVGRVLNHDKPAAYVFTEDDFFPTGTRAGLVAGIPAGKRAIRVDASKVNGLVGLQPGDRFDLIATIPIEVGSAGGSQVFRIGGVYGQQLALQNQLTNWQKQATVRVLVQNGTIVEPMTNRQVPVNTSTLTNGLVTRLKTVQEIVVAVGPDEVARLTEALAVNAEINCVPRSGRPDDPENSVTPELQPWSPFVGLIANGGVPQPGQEIQTVPGSSSNALTAIESISGSKRDMIAAPRQR